MKVSVVIPVYNEEQFIRRTLTTLTKQKQLPDEIIVVDNNSTDKTVDIAKEFKLVKVIVEKKQGIVPARNAGFNTAIGDIILRCDADSILPENWIAEVKSAFQDKTTAGAAGPGYYYDLPFSQIQSALLNFSLFGLTRFILGHHILFGPNMAVRKTAWERIKDTVCNDKAMHEDIDVGIHLKELGTILYLKNIAVGISGRRLVNRPLSAFVEYPARWIYTLFICKHSK